MAATILGLSFYEGIVAAFFQIDSHIEPNRSPGSVSGSWWSYFGQWYCRWWRTASASQSWVCHSLLVTGDNGAFSVAGELLTKSSLRCLMAVRGVWSKRLSGCHGLFIGSSSGDCLAFLLWRLPSFPTLANPLSQLIKTSLEALAGFP